MKCLIIAAGKGSRLAHKVLPKPLVPLLGIPLVERVIRTFIQAGVQDFFVVTGFQNKQIQEHLSTFALTHQVNVDFIYNPRWEEPNGISVHCARAKLDEPFFLSMSDHLFDKAVLEELQTAGVTPGEVKLAVDLRLKDNPSIDPDDVTKVLVQDKRILDIGKNIPVYNAFDTGIFLCTPALFPALEESFAAGDASLSGGIRRLAAKQKALAFDIGNRFWLDIDDETAFNKAERFLIPEK